MVVSGGSSQGAIWSWLSNPMTEMSAGMAETGTADGTVGAHGHAVGVALDGGRRIGQVRGAEPCRDRTTEGIVPVDGHERQGRTRCRARPAHVGSRRSARLGGIRVVLMDVADASVAVLDEVAWPRCSHRAPRRARPRSRSDRLLRAVEEDGMDILAARRRLHDVVPHGGVDEGVDLTGQHRVDGPGLDLGVALGVDDHERHARGRGDLVGAVDHEAGERRGGDGVADEADGLARSGGAGCGRRRWSGSPTRDWPRRRAPW